jgi:hypothetical protein
MRSPAPFAVRGIPVIPAEGLRADPTKADEDFAPETPGVA